MPTSFKKIILSFLSFLLLFFSVAPYLSVSAQVGPSVPTTNVPGQTQTPAQSTTWYDQDFWTWSNKVNNTSNPSEIFGERYTSAQVEWVIYGLVNFLLSNVLGKEIKPCIFNSTSIDLTPCMDAVKKYLGVASLDTSGNNLASGQKESLLSEVFATDRPMSGIAYIHNKIANFSLVTPVHAQTTAGFGFAALTTVQNMWVVFRNMSYGLFVFMAVVLAFMIMFRVKISPQVVISIQSAIPKMIMALITVTFSYAIAGFLIDFMYIVIGLVSVLAVPLIPKTVMFWPQNYTASDIFKLLTIGNHTTGVFGGIFGLLTMYLMPVVIIATIFAVGFAIAAIWAAPLVFIALGILLILLLLILWYSIKIFWSLLKAFANVLLLTIFSPLYLSLGTLVPNFGFGQWVRNYISALSTFVVTGVLWLFAWIFMLNAWAGTFPGGNLTIPSNGFSFTGTENPWPPLLGGGGLWPGIIMLGASFVLFTMIPKATEVVQAFLSGKPFAYGSAIGEAVAPFKGAWSNTGGVAIEGIRRKGAEDFGQAAIPKILDFLDRYNIHPPSGKR